MYPGRTHNRVQADTVVVLAPDGSTRRLTTVNSFWKQPKIYKKKRNRQSW